MKEELATLQNLVNLAVEFVFNYSFQVIGAIIILIIGVYSARWLSNLVIKICQQRDLDVTLTKFMGSLIKIMVLMFAIIVALGKFGISIAPFIAAVGALAFGASFAIQGPLSNYGSGLAIVLTRPFVVGNTLTVKGVSGVVEEISLAYTILTTEDEERITVPNNKIMGEILQNSFENRIVEVSIGIAYHEDPQKAIEVIRKALERFPDIASEPEPLIGIERFADSAVEIGIRCWVPTKVYFHRLYEINMAVFEALQASQITIPFPQRDVHVIPQPQAAGSVVSQQPRAGQDKPDDA